MKKNLILFIIFFLILSFFGLLQIIDLDIIWAYGFSYNIANGLLPYKDFNMVIGPLYSFLFSIPLFIFKNNLLVFKLAHIFIYSIILVFIYKRINKKIIFILFMFFIQSTMFWYNTFIAALIMLILYLLDSDYKYKDIIIGLIIGFIFMTKHNIGIFLLPIYLITQKNKIKSLIAFSFVLIFTITTIIINNSFMGYIDFCYLGLGNFLDNIVLDPITIILTIILISYLVYQYINSKDIKILYLFSFLIVLFPLFEGIHFIVYLLPFSYYFFLKNNNAIFDRIIKVFIIFGCVINLFGLYNSELLLENNPLKYNITKKGVNKYLKEFSLYINKSDEKKYLLMKNAYLIRLYNNETIDFYDLINKGNLGKDEKKYISKIDENCKNEKCTFILDSLYFKKKKDVDKKQLLYIFKKYITDNYKYVETLPSKDRVYTNY